MKKITFLFTIILTLMLFTSVSYAAGIRLEGTTERNLKVGDVTSKASVKITLNGNELKLLNDKITVTLNSANWDGYAKSGSINSEVTYELTAPNVMKLKIATNEETLKSGYSFSIPLNSKITKAQQNISAVINYGYSDIAENTVNYASCDISRAYLNGVVKVHNTGDKIYQSSDKSTYNELKIWITPSDADKTKGNITIKYDGAIWSDYKESGKVTCDKSTGVNYRKVDNNTLQIYFDEFNNRMRYEGYTLTLPMTGTITGKGEIKAVVDFGTDAVDTSTVVFARCYDGELSIKAENPNTLVDNCAKLSNIVVTDSSTQGYNNNTKIEIQLMGTFHFIQVPEIECTGKFEDSCKIELKKDNNQKCIITITKNIKSGSTGEIKLVTPIIERTASNSSFTDVEINLTAKGWEKYDSTAKVAKYQEGVAYIPPVQINSANPYTGAGNKYAALAKITLSDSTERKFKAGDKITLSFDNGFKIFTGGSLPKMTSTGKFKDNCRLTISESGAYITVLNTIEGSKTGTIEINGIVLERSLTDAYEYIKVKAVYSGEEDNYSTAQVAKFSSLYTNVPATTTTVSTTTEATTETTTTVNNSKSTVKFKIGDVKYTVNGENKELLAAPYIKDGYTMLPMRALANAVGITDDKISYSNGTAVFKIKDGVELAITKDSSEYTLAGQNIKVSAAAEIKNGTMFLPMRDLATAIGISSDGILFDSVTKEVTLNID